MRYLFLLLFLSCQQNVHKPKFKIGECFTGGDWVSPNSQLDNDFGNTIYWKLKEVKKSAYIFTIHQINSNQYIGSVAQKFELMDQVLEKIDCPK